MILTSHSEEVKQVPLKPAVEERQRSFSNLTTLNIPGNKISISCSKILTRKTKLNLVSSFSQSLPLQKRTVIRILSYFNSQVFTKDRSEGEEEEIERENHCELCQ